METIQPKVIYLYGSEPFEYFGRQIKGFKQDEIRVAELSYGKASLYATRHLSYQTSYIQVRELAHHTLKPIANELTQKTFG